MKNLFIFLAIAALSIFAYRQWEQQTPPPVVVATPPPTPPVVPTPAPPEQHLMPEGTFAVVEYVSVRTKSGVVGFEPGQPVRFVKADAKKGLLTVTDGTYQVEVKPDQLTNDLDIAKIAKRQDQESQQRLHESLASARDEDLRARHEADVARATDVAKLPSGSRVGTSSTLSQGSTAASSFDAAYNESVRRGYRGYYRSPYYYLYQ